MLEDLQCVYQASSDVDGGNVTAGYPYSLLEWCAEPHTIWPLPLDVRRIASQQTAQEVGVEQIQALAKARQTCLEALDIVLADGKYGNVRFLSGVSSLRVGVVAWTAYVNRWPIEPSMRFRKETLGWTLPRFQNAQTGDTWTQLVALVHWMLFLAHPLVQDNPLPWQKAQTRLTPQRVRQSL